MKIQRGLIVSLVMLMVGAAMTLAGPVYVVSGVKNGVKAKKNKSASWVSLNRLDKIGVLDSLEITPGGALDFYNAGDGRRYHVDSAKRLRVADAVNSTKNSGKKGVIESVISTGFPPEEKERRRPAATHRGAEDEDSVALAIYSVVMSGNASENPCGIWIARRPIDGYFTLSIGNKGAETAYVELYAVRTDGRVERVDIMDEANTPLVGGASVELPFEFAETPDIKYMLVGCNQPFDPTSLAKFINSKKSGAPVEAGKLTVCVAFAE